MVLNRLKFLVKSLVTKFRLEKKEREKEKQRKEKEKQRKEKEEEKIRKALEDKETSKKDRKRVSLLSKPPSITNMHA